jgi:cytochrome c-type biogenesis protein CcmH
MSDRIEAPLRRGRAWLLALTLGLMSAIAFAQASAPTTADPALDARVQAIANELRCLVCQNQTIAESHAGLAVDLRRQVREMLVRGDSEKQVIDYMTARYGDFVLYRPPVKSSTALLWYGPAALLLLAATSVIVMLRRRRRMPADRFEPEPDDGATGSLIDPRTSPVVPGSNEASR